MKIKSFLEWNNYDEDYTEEIAKIVKEFAETKMGEEESYSFRYGVDLIDFGSGNPPDGMDFREEYEELANELIVKLRLYAEYELCELSRGGFTLCKKSKLK